MARALCLEVFDAFGRCLPSGMGLPCFLASAPNFFRTARIFIIAAAISAMISAAIFCSLIYRPAAETSVAERTLVHAVELTAGAGRIGGCVATTTAVRTLFDPGTSARGGCRRDAFAK